MDYNELKSQVSALLERFAEENRCSVSCEVSLERIVPDVDNVPLGCAVPVKYNIGFKLDLYGKKQ